jgi:hypothetical protein
VLAMNQALCKEIEWRKYAWGSLFIWLFWVLHFHLISFPQMSLTFK